MNSKQRRTYKRMIQRELYSDIRHGLSQNYRGTYTKNIYPAFGAILFDFPANDKDEKIVYVKIPSYHLINPSANGSKSKSITIKIHFGGEFDELRNLSVLDEYFPFKDTPSSLILNGRFPVFRVKTNSDYSYWFIPGIHTTDEIQLKKISDSVFEDSDYNINSTSINPSEILDDPNVPKKTKIALAFNMHILTGNKDE